MRHHVLLIPGFFGFEALGDMRYFVGVTEHVERAFEEQGHEVVVSEVDTLPTASLRARASRVLDHAAALDDGPLHLVGHSTGGLDARLAIAASASLPTDADPAAVQERVASVVTVCTPHGGSPLASFFGGVAGQPLLRLVTALGVLVVRRMPLPVDLLVKLGNLVRRADDLAGLDDTVLDELYRDLLGGFDEERRAELVRLLEQIHDDTSLVFQLTPEGTDLLDAATGDPPETRYGCVVARAPRPALRTTLAHRQDIYAQTLHVVFALLHTVVSRGRSRATADDAQRAALREALGEVSDRDNDGIVPTLTQAWGEVVGAVSADHLDVVGHFGGGFGTDWLPAATEFGDADFESLWTDIARFQLGACSGGTH